MGVGSLSCTKCKADSRPRAAAGLEVSGGAEYLSIPRTAYCVSKLDQLCVGAAITLQTHFQDLDFSQHSQALFICANRVNSNRRALAYIRITPSAKNSMLKYKAI